MNDTCTFLKNNGIDRKPDELVVVCMFTCHRDGSAKTLEHFTVEEFIRRKRTVFDAIPPKDRAMLNGAVELPINADTLIISIFPGKGDAVHYSTTLTGILEC